MDPKKNRDFEEFIHYLIDRDFKPRTVIDVGACYGTPELFRNLPDAYHIYFEPIPAMEERLKLLSQKFPGEYHMIALADKPGAMALRFPAAQPEAGSLVAAIGEQENESLVEINVPIDTLDAVLGDRELERPLLLKTDCQGFDLDVMRGGRELLTQVDVVISEVNLYHAAGDESRPVFSEMVTYMAAVGFEVFDVISYNRRPLDEALGYVDLAFVRKEGSLWSTHRWA